MTRRDDPQDVLENYRLLLRPPLGRTWTIW